VKTIEGRLQVVLEVDAGEAGEGERAADVVTRYIREQYQALAAGDVSLRRGRDTVHPTRVATRRLRSTLRVFAAMFDLEAAGRLDEELAWYAGLLGQVRDRQVQRARFSAALAELPPEHILGPVAARIEARLLAEQAQHLAELMSALDSDRYRDLLSTVAAWVESPPLAPEADEDADHLLRLVGKARRRAVKRVKAALRGEPDAEPLHRARKSAKRARYAVELAAELLDESAAKSAIAFNTAVQDALGEHQDSVVAADLMRELGAQAGITPGENGFTFGLLYAREQAAAQRARETAQELVRQLRNDT
jgi:CHAD domain-containing protein